MFVKDFNTKIKEAMKADDKEKFFEAVGKAVSYYADRINKAFVVIPQYDIPYMIAAIDLFRGTLLGLLAEDEREEVEALAKDIKELCRVSIVRCFTSEPVTEEAAQEWYAEMRNNKEMP